eukprot:TRINITY_DN5455_c0_g2_i1.p1 TRINITY_DN5455_c0_g2~~TRINITY_DN5455_c0_g2_i1.p1  ORF type:complete len:167 (-),score=61.04 TRINITY_DN5455_c0_g2_i1:279-779(-)
MERNLHDATNVARSILLNPRIVAGGGAIEMAVAARLTERASSQPPAVASAYRAIATALEVIPRVLVQNCGASVLRVMTDLRARHAAAATLPGTDPATRIGVDGDAGVLVNTFDAGIIDPVTVKAQTIKSAVECACMLVRIDAVVSGISGAGGGGGGRAAEDADGFD